MSLQEEWIANITNEELNLTQVSSSLCKSFFGLSSLVQWLQETPPNQEVVSGSSIACQNFGVWDFLLVLGIHSIFKVTSNWNTWVTWSPATKITGLEDPSLKPTRD